MANFEAPVRKRKGAFSSPVFTARRSRAVWSPRSRVSTITLVYAMVSIVWIYFSDYALLSLALDQETLARWSVFKGLAFVAVTSALLFWLMWKAFGALEQAYAALRELNGSLEEKVSGRTHELENALNRARDADRLKSAFLATMSHELRTPLNSIIGFTGIVLQGMAGPLTPEQQRQLGMVRGSARHLLDLINDVLDLSKIEAGQLQVRAEAFDISDSAHKVVGLVQPLAEQKGLRLQVEITPDVGSMYSDRRRVEQILINLLNNAIKFTDEGGAVIQLTLDPAFHVNAQAPPCQALRIQVRDTGIGIKPEDIGTLFHPFSQVDNGLTRAHEGTGLGLAICSRLVKLLGGTITVRSVWSEGTIFTVTLPLEMS
ncbi:MAG: hypothetical protein CL536_04895 [Alcaligenaceae bacterium]|nr:hypothetical protein [Alcaligenaceae bacterium]